MDGNKAKAIWQTNAGTREELRECDAWIRRYTTDRAKQLLRQYPPEVRDYLITCVSAHYGAVETDNFLKAIKAYPDWML